METTPPASTSKDEEILTDVSDASEEEKKPGEEKGTSRMPKRPREEEDEEKTPAEDVKGKGKATATDADGDLDMPIAKGEEAGEEEEEEDDDDDENEDKGVWTSEYITADAKLTKAETTALAKKAKSDAAAAKTKTAETTTTEDSKGKKKEDTTAPTPEPDERKKLTQIWYVAKDKTLLPVDADPYEATKYILFAPPASLTKGATSSGSNMFWFLSEEKWNSLRHIGTDEYYGWPAEYKSKIVSALFKNGNRQDWFFGKQPPGSFSSVGQEVDPSYEWVDFWDSLFEKGQADAIKLMAEGKVPTDFQANVTLRWKPRLGSDPGTWQSNGKDDRKWDVEKTDGIYFRLKKPKMSECDPNQKYVKLREDGCARFLCDQDRSAALRGVNHTEMYVPENIINGLVDQTAGLWTYYDRLYFRNAAGERQFVFVNKTPDWEDARDAGLRSKNGYGRGRTCKNLHLILVAEEGPMQLTVAELQKLVDDMVAKKKAKGLKEDELTTATVMSTKDFESNGIVGGEKAEDEGEQAAEGGKASEGETATEAEKDKTEMQVDKKEEHTEGEKDKMEMQVDNEEKTNMGEKAAEGEKVNTKMQVDKEEKVNEAEGGKGGKKFSDDYCPLAVSPFGDYTTWIHKDAYISWLKSYPSYALPTGAATDTTSGLGKVVAALQNLQLKRQIVKKFPEDSKKDPKAIGHVLGRLGGFASGSTSDDTVGLRASAVGSSRLGKPGARKKMPSQGVLMGDSATAVAKAAGWPFAASDIPQVIDADTGITWGPATAPSEWLHRCALSWGHPSGYGLNQVPANLVFGSNEANSLMTRYEESWQALFKEYSKLQPSSRGTSSAKAASRGLNGILWTWNTRKGKEYPVVFMEAKVKDATAAATKTPPKDGTAETEAPSKDSSAETETPILNSQVEPVATEFTSDQTGETRLWDAVGAMPNLSFRLDYGLLLDPTGTLPVPHFPTTVFFPFGRGLLTTLETAVDKAILNQLIDQVKAAVATPTAPTAPPTAPGDGGPTLTLPIHPIRVMTTAPDLGGGGGAPLLNEMASKVTDATDTGNAAMQLNSPLIISSQAPSQLPHNDTWQAATNGDEVAVGGVALTNPSVALVDDKNHLLHIPMSTDSTDVNEQGQTVVTALQAASPLTLAGLGTVSAHPDQLPSQEVAVVAPPQVSDPDTNDIPKSFVLTGSVKLFRKFDESLYAYYGSAALGGTKQIVPIQTGQLKLSDYIPKLSGTEYDSLPLYNTVLVYNQYTTATDMAGTWLQTDIEFSGALQPIADFLKNVLHQQQPRVRVQALLSQKNDWTRPVSLSGLSLRGSLPAMSAKVGDLLTITNLGASISISSVQDTWPPYKKRWTHSQGLFGSALLNLPHDMAPVSVDVSMIEGDGFMTVMADVAEDDSFGLGFAGIAGLKLQQLSLTTVLATSSSPSVVSFDAAATISLRDTTLSLSGFYSKADWGFTCELEDLDMAGLRNLYEDLFGKQLHVSDHEVVFQDLQLVAGPSGLVISGAVTVETYTSASATISISNLGVEIQGEIDDVKLDGDLTLQSASLDIFVGRQEDTTAAGPGTSWRFAIAGTVDVLNNTATASLYLDKEAATGKTLWTVVGTFSGAFSLAKLDSKLKGSALDLSLQSVALIASNMDGVAVSGAIIPAAYPVIKGVQVAASLAPIDRVGKTLSKSGAPTGGLTLRAIYAADTSSFQLNIDFASPQRMSMNSGTVQSGDVSLAIITSGTLPTIMFTADMFIKVPNQPDPLKFIGGGSLDPDEAKLFFEMDGWWRNPFGLSSQVALGPKEALDITVVFESPIWPSGFGIDAGIAIGNVTGHAALSISDAPNDELIDIEVDNLGIQDLVRFASLLIEHDLPVPNDNFLLFKLVHLYLSTGTTIATTVYPPGASFTCDALIFDHELNIYCGFNKAQKQIQATGSLQALSVGPVTIGGYDPGTPATMSLQLGSAQQSLSFSGGVGILDMHAKIKVDATIMPSPSFSLNAELDFSSHLTFTLIANMRNNGSGGGGGSGGGFRGGMAGMKALDFDVDFSFHQDILDYLVTQVNSQVIAAKHSLDDGADKAKKTLDDAQRDFKKRLDDAHATLADAQTKWDARSGPVKAALAREQAADAIKTKQLTDDVTKKVAELNEAIDKAKTDLQNAETQRTIAINQAKQKVTDAKANGDRDIDDHLRQLNNAKADMQRRFGDAENKVASAQRDVDNAQREVDGAQREVDQAKHDLDHAKVFDKIPKAAKVAAAGTKLEGLQGGLKSAQGVLSLARKVIDGPGYAAAKESVAGYQKLVDTARETADKTLNAANFTLQETQHAQDALVSKAENALTLVQSSGMEKHLADAAKAALAGYQTLETKTLAELGQAVDDLSKTAEAAALAVANAGLKVAEANTKDVDIARAAVAAGAKASGEVMDAGNWLIAHTANILNLRSVDLSGDFRGMCAKSSELKAHIVGTFAEQPIDFSVDFTPGKGEDMAKRLFEKLLADMKAGILKIVH